MQEQLRWIADHIRNQIKLENLPNPDNRRRRNMNSFKFEVKTLGELLSLVTLAQG